MKTKEAQDAGKRAVRVQADPKVPDFAKDKMQDIANEKAMEGYQERKKKGMKSGGCVKKMKSGGAVRGCGAAKKGVKKAKMY